jgi:MFS family permease
MSLVDSKYEIYSHGRKAKRWYSFFDEEEYRVKPNESEGKKWYHWFHEDDTREEKVLLFKLDLILAFYSFIIYWIKYMDQTNLNNAYVSGMKQALHMEGNDLVNVQVMYTIGDAVFQVPFSILFPHVRMDLLLPTFDIAWGLFTLAQYKATSTQELMAFRFLVGMSEAAFFPGVLYLFGCFYKSHEINRRLGIFYLCNMLGSLTVGLMQASIYKHLNGRNGLQGWQYLYIVNAAITIPVGFLGFIIWPGTPSKLHSIFLTKREGELILNRIQKSGIAGPKGFNKRTIIKALTNWHFYAIVSIAVFFLNAQTNSTGTFVLWLDTLGYSTERVNNLSVITPALGILYVILICGFADQFRSRWGAIVISHLLNFLGLVILSVWNVPIGAKWFAYCLQYFQTAMSSVLYGWANDITRFDDEYRSFIVTMANCIGHSTLAWTPLLVWQTSESPRFPKGFPFAATSSVLCIVATLITLYLYKRDERLNYEAYLNLEAEEQEETSSNEKNNYGEQIVDE